MKGARKVEYDTQNMSNFFKIYIFSSQVKLSKSKRKQFSKLYLFILS